ncbi:MAG: ABC transporter ATP-binding protein [Bacteroidia bacterium]
MSSIAVNNITKTYSKGATLAIDDISFSVDKGEMFGLIGPDGAGKTSIFRMLTTLLLPDKGTATVAGYDIVKDFRKIRGVIGYMPGRFSLYQDLSVEENLRFFATVFGTTIKENYDQIKDIYEQIEPFKTRRAGKLSGGMKQKLALCCALVHKPTVLFLDEPTTGVDVVSRKEFWEMLKRLKQQGITILVSTSYMDEATLCDRIGLILGGKILSMDTPANIVQAYPEKLYAIKSPEMHKLLHDVRSNEEILTCYASGEYIHLSFRNPETDHKAVLLSYLQEKGNINLVFKETTPTIEDCFISLLGKKDGNSN